MDTQKGCSMGRLHAPLVLTAIYVILLALATLSPFVVRIVFGYAVKDPGVLLVLSAAFWGSGVILWAIASYPESYSTLAGPVIVYLLIFIIFLLWGWRGRFYTPQNITLPLIINSVLVVWIWLVRKR